MIFRSCENLDRSNEKRYKRNLNSLIEHDATEYRAHFLVGYTGIFSIGQIQLSLENDFFTITGPGDHYLISVSGNSEHCAYYSIVFELDKSDDELKDYIKTEICGRKFLLDRTKRFLFDDIIRMNISPDSRHRKAGIYLFMSLIYGLSTTENPAGRGGHSGRIGRQELIDKATEYMRNQVLHKMQLSEVSSYLNISPPHLVRVFTAELGISPMKYYNRAKIEAVAVMLTSTDQTIDSIADQYGFSSAPHLSKVFKQFMGVPPKTYRNNYIASSTGRQKTSFKELENAYELLHRIVDESPDFIFYKDTNGIILYCNKTFCRLLGKQLDQIIGKTDYDLFPKDEAEFYINNDTKIFRTKQPYRNREWMIHPDGSRRNYEVYKAPFYDNNGNILGLIGISRDITYR